MLGVVEGAFVGGSGKCARIVVIVLPRKFLKPSRPRELEDSKQIVFDFFLSSFSDNTKKIVSVKGFSLSGTLTSHPEQMSAGLNGTKRKDSIFTLWT